jgi:hypothetical protein
MSHLYDALGQDRLRRERLGCLREVAAKTLKPVFGLARPSLAWSKELRPRQLLHDLPPGRLVTSPP